MSRAIVYRRSAADSVGPEPPDGYKEQVAKYVPGEALALWVAVLAALQPATKEHGLYYGIAALAGLVGTLGYQLYNGSRLPADQKPYPHFYVLAAISFPVWALFGFEEAQQWLTGKDKPDMAGPAVLFLVWFFLVPAIDFIIVTIGRALHWYPTPPPGA